MQFEKSLTLEAKNQSFLGTNETLVVENDAKHEECAPSKIVPKMTSAVLKEDEGGKSYNTMRLSHNESEALKAAVARAIGVYAKPQAAPSVSSTGHDDLPALQTVLAVSVNAAYFKCKLPVCLHNYLQPFPIFCCARSARLNNPRNLCVLSAQSIKTGCATRSASASSI